MVTSIFNLLKGNTTWQGIVETVLLRVGDQPRLPIECLDNKTEQQTNRKPKIKKKQKINQHPEKSNFYGYKQLCP